MKKVKIWSEKDGGIRIWFYRCTECYGVKFKQPHFFTSGSELRWAFVMEDADMHIGLYHR